MTMELFQVGVDILNTTLSTKTKKILAQTGTNVGAGLTQADGVEWWQPQGLASRPSKPDKGKEAAQALVIRNGTIDCAIACQDLRSLPIYGELDHGETCLFAGGLDGRAQGRVLIKKDGSVNIFTKSGNTSAGDGMGIFVNPDGSISVASHKGNAVLLQTDGAVKIFNASGGVLIQPDGSIKLASGAKVEISGASVTLGGATALPVALGPPTLAAIGAIALALGGVYSAAAGKASGSPGGTVTNADLKTVLEPLVAMATAVGLQAPLIQSKRTSSD